MSTVVMDDSIRAGDLLDLLPAAVYVCDASGVIKRYNRRAAELWGHAPCCGDTDQRFCGAYRLYHMNGTPLPHADTPMAEVLRTGVPVRDQEVEIERPDGSRVTVLVNIAPLRNELGELVGAVNCFQDITERKAVESALRSSEKELSDFFDNAAVALHWVGPDGVILRANRAELELLGYARDEYVGHPIAEFHVDAPVIEDILRRLTAGEVLHDYPARLRCKDGSIKHVLIDSSVLREQGEFRHTRCFTRDVTASVRLAELRERAHARTVVLKELAVALSGAATPANVAEAVLAHAVDALGASSGVILSVSPDGAELEVIQARGVRADLLAAWRSFPLSASVPLTDAIRRGEPIFLESLADWIELYPEVASIPEQVGRHAHLVEPLIVENRTLGALGLGFDAPRAFSEEDRAFALVIAQQCAQALERAKLFEAEQRARQEAERANRVKTDFLAMMSHELRTPLNAIAGYAQLIEMGVHGPVTEAQLEDLRRIQRSQHHLLALINDVLNFAKIEAGHVEFDIQDVPLSQVQQNLEPLITPQLHSKQLRYEFRGWSGAVGVRADPERLQQILLNLLSNAIKFTPVGGRITVECEVADGTVSIRVRDTGHGIPAERLERVFEPFVQLDRSLTAQQEGVGLGLAISRDLARAMGGDLRATSVVGEGSTFVLTLPG
ncbi:MAG TPA: ATP-binding protein [Longimicrobiaceae bacterium]|nr:ATP-binding protein [Longimicrobiaceae bacterium]